MSIFIDILQIAGTALVLWLAFTGLMVTVVRISAAWERRSLHRRCDRIEKTLHEIDDELRDRGLVK